ncbi:MAG: APC family permease [Sphingomonadales bacterium]|nr:APC family permease [Sphingomonadales bacterium]
MSEQQSLAKGALSALESTIMGIAGTSPAFTVAVTTGTIYAAIGPLSVGSLLYSGVIMLGIMFAFAKLNRVMPDAGAAFAWVGKVFGPTWGFFAGWGLMVASVVFMVSATLPAATATLLLLAPDQVENTPLVTAIAAIWLTLVTWIVLRGIKHASTAQVTVTVIEAVIVVALLAAAVYWFGSHPAHVPSVAWVSPASFTFKSFADGAIVSVFFYWGWDVTMNLGEETEPEDASKGAFWAMINLIVFFVILMTVVLIALSDKEIAAANTNVLYAISAKIFPAPWSYLVVLATVLSTVGALETQILQFSRSMYSMARADVLPPFCAAVHRDWQTPWVATLVIWALGLVLLFGASYMPSVAEILQSSIEAIGLQICFYMGLTGYASAWHFRTLLRTDLREAFTHVIMPLIGALFMTGVAVWVIPTFSQAVLVVGIGGLLSGFLPLLLWAAWKAWVRRPVAT